MKEDLNRQIQKLNSRMNSFVPSLRHKKKKKWSGFEKKKNCVNLRATRGEKKIREKKKRERKIKSEIIVSRHSSCQCLSTMAGSTWKYFHKIFGR